MHRPSRWWLGLPVLAILLLASLWLTAPRVQRDVAASAGAAVAGRQLIDPVVSSAGRDVSISGLAVAPPERQGAIEAADAARGVRLVKATITDLPVQKPYTIAFTRAASGVTLSGHAPSPAVRQALVAAAGALGKTEDKLSWAAGAPADLVSAQAKAAIDVLTPLASGTASVTDGALTVSGQAVDRASYDKALAALRTLPQGVRLAKADITAPKESPYRFSAQREGAGVTLTGFVPDEATRAALIEAARKVGSPVTDRLAIASGAPAGFTAMGQTAIAALAPLASGSASLSDTALTVTGSVADPASYDRALAAVATLPQGLTLAKADIALPHVSPFVFEARRDPTTVTLTGYAPGADARKRLAESAAKLGLKVEDKLALAAGAPQGFETMAQAAVQALSSLTQGVVSLRDGVVTVNGRAVDAAARDSMFAMLRGLGLPGFTFNALDVFAPRRRLSEAEYACQGQLLDRLANQTIEFETGSARVSGKSLPLVKTLADVIKACPSVDLEVAGFTDNVGDIAKNVELSRDRADAVIKILAESGAPAERLSAVGYGQESPIATNDTPEGRARNRRIEFSVK